MVVFNLNQLWVKFEVNKFIGLIIILTINPRVAQCNYQYISDRKSLSLFIPAFLSTLGFSLSDLPCSKRKKVGFDILKQILSVLERDFDSGSLEDYDLLIEGFTSNQKYSKSEHIGFSAIPSFQPFFLKLFFHQIEVKGVSLLGLNLGMLLIAQTQLIEAFVEYQTLA